MLWAFILCASRSFSALGPHPPSSAWVIILHSPLMPRLFGASLPRCIGRRPPRPPSVTSGPCPLVHSFSALGLNTPSSALGHHPLKSSGASGHHPSLSALGCPLVPQVVVLWCSPSVHWVLVLLQCLSHHPLVPPFIFLQCLRFRLPFVLGDY